MASERPNIKYGERTVGVYDRPERKRWPVVLIFVIAAVILAIVVLWLTLL